MRNDKLGRVTGRAMQIALEGFPLNFVGDWDHEKLACRVKEALSQPLSQYEVNAGRTSNADIKTKLSIISRNSKNLLKYLNSLSGDTDDILSDYSNYNNYIGFIMNLPGESESFGEIVERLRQDLSIMESYLNNAAVNIKIQKAKWKQTEVKILRVKCGEALIGVFEQAFGRPIQLNNWAKGGGDARHKSPTSFMVFYQCVMHILFDEKVTKNLADILKEARAAHVER